MYGALWRAIPGPWPVKLLVMLVLIAAVLYAMVTWVFPWVDETFLKTGDDITVGMQLVTAARLQ
nr:hypothetical protein [Pseudoclavibacter sp. Marseille-Q3772]